MRGGAAAGTADLFLSRVSKRIRGLTLARCPHGQSGDRYVKEDRRRIETGLFHPNTSGEGGGVTSFSRGKRRETTTTGDGGGEKKRKKNAFQHTPDYGKKGGDKKVFEPKGLPQ